MKLSHCVEGNGDYILTHRARSCHRITCYLVSDLHNYAHLMSKRVKVSGVPSLVALVLVTYVSSCLDIFAT